MEDGRITAEGTHDELPSNAGGNTPPCSPSRPNGSLLAGNSADGASTSLDTLSVLVEFPFRVDPFRCASGIALLVLSQLAAIGSALALGVITDTVIGKEASRAVVGSALLVVAIVIAQAASWASFVVRSALRERTSLVADRELTELLAAPVGIEHLERPEYLDRVEYLRQNREQLTAVPSHIAIVLAVVLRLAATLVVLVAIEPVLLLLPLFILPLVVVSTLRNRRVGAVLGPCDAAFAGDRVILRRLVGTERRPSQRDPCIWYCKVTCRRQHRPAH